MIAMIKMYNQDCMELMKRYDDNHFDLAININDLQIGKAGEYLVCADLILNGYIAYPSEQGLPYDVVMDYNNRLLKVQVKSTRKAKEIPQRKTSIPAYIFHVGTNGSLSKNVWTELDKDYYQDAKKRYENHAAQLQIF